MTESLYAPGRGRRAEQRRRRRQRRRRLVGGGLVALLLLAVVVAGYLVQRAPEPSSAVEPQARTQQTLLLQVRGQDGSAVASALLAHDEASTAGSAVLVPPQVIVDLPGAGSLPFGQALSTGGPDGPRDALSDLLAVDVDDTWVLESAAFTALVDALGGVQVSVDVPVEVGGQVLAQPGEQQLGGQAALAFAQFLAPGEQEQARLARLQEVLDGVVTALPADPAEVAELLTGLGSDSVVSSTPEELADFLLGLRADGQAQQLQYDTLPVVPIDPGGGVVAFRLDPEAARALVDRLLAQSVPAGARETGNRVLVLNGVGTPGIGDAVRARLVPEGFVFVGSRNAENFDYATTQVLVPEATPEGQALGERVAAALGLPAEVRTAELGSIADVVVVVGADFVP